MKLYQVGIILAILTVFIVFLSYLTRDNRRLTTNAISLSSPGGTSFVKRDNFIVSGGGGGETIGNTGGNGGSGGGYIAGKNKHTDY